LVIIGGVYLLYQITKKLKIMTAKIKIINSGTWIKIQIVSVTEGFSQTLVNGKWVNKTSEPQIFEDELLTIGKCFSDSEEASKFINTKFFKSLFKAIEKHQSLFYK
jgi:hypothetical protein